LFVCPVVRWLERVAIEQRRSTNRGHATNLARHDGLAPARLDQAERETREAHGIELRLMPRYAAMLRGINVGGKNILPMKDLATLFTKAGARKVETYVQSGNVIFDAAAKAAARFPALIETAIAKQFGFSSPVILRSAEELAKVAKSHPAHVAGEDTKPLHVMFLADSPDPKRLADLDPKRSPPDTFTVKGREIYLLLPNGVARSKLTNAYFDSRLGTVTTIRNWNTVLRLCEMTAGSP
jgi:uncharacterized protein (DUF1697 family)